MGSNESRLDEILHHIVESYIETAEPVGSRAVSRDIGNLSPATIRNVMMELEERGYIHQPHISAGRVPTDRGYRYYVDSLIDWDGLDEVDVPDVAPILREAEDIEEVAQSMSRVLAELTGHAGILYLKSVRRVSYLTELKREIEAMIREERMRVDDLLCTNGTGRVLEQPEFRDVSRIRELIRALEAKEVLASLLQKDLEDHRVHIHIGDEMSAANMNGVSVVVKEYLFHGVPIGCLGVMGPTRMKYDRAVGVVEKLADAMTDFLNA